MNPDEAVVLRNLFDFFIKRFSDENAPDTTAVRQMYFQRPRGIFDIYDIGIGNGHKALPRFTG